MLPLCFPYKILIIDENGRMQKGDRLSGFMEVNSERNCSIFHKYVLQLMGGNCRGRRKDGRSWFDYFMFMI